MMPTSAVGFLLLAVSLTGECRAPLKAGCKFETLRQCGDDYIPFGSTAQIAASRQGFQDKCAQEKKQVVCTHQFVNNCLEGAPHIAALMALDSLQETLDGVCTAGSDAYKGYHRAAKCMNTAGTKIHACLQDLKGTLQKAVIKAPSKQLIPYNCCAYGDMVDCVGKALLPCEGVGAKEYLLGLMDRVMGKTLKLVCTDHPKGSAACRALPKLVPLGPRDRKVDNYVELLIKAAATIES
ncbi:uncharacterized protein LOC144134611 [Amblyomma americanum]